MLLKVCNIIGDMLEIFKKNCNSYNILLYDKDDYSIAFECKQHTYEQ